VLVDGPINARTIVSANESARAAGLHVGQRLSAAQALLSQFEAIPYDRESVDGGTGSWLLWLTATAPRSACCRMRSCWKSARAWACSGRGHGLNPCCVPTSPTLGFRHRMAAAPTAHAAHVLTTVSDGQAVLTVDTLRNALAAVPIAKSRLPANAIAALPSMGIRTLGQVLALPRDGLRRRFGAELLASLDRLTGDLPSGLESCIAHRIRSICASSCFMKWKTSRR
jgi:protein ImuB